MVDLDQYPKFDKLEPRVARLESEMETMIHAVDRMASKIDDLANSLLKGKTIDWQAIFTGLTVLVLVVAAMGGAILLPIKQQVNYLERNQSEHERLAGHSEALVMHSRMDERLKRVFDTTGNLNDRINILDNHLQAEMRLLNEKTEQKINHFYEVLQREIQLYHGFINEKIDGLDKKIDVRTADRYTKAEAVEHIERLRDRLARLENLRLEQISDR